jgi:hypothetical protein
MWMLDDLLEVNLMIALYRARHEVVWNWYTELVSYSFSMWGTFKLVLAQNFTHVLYAYFVKLYIFSLTNKVLKYKERKP